MRIQFTNQPVDFEDDYRNQFPIWFPSNMKIDGVRVWSRISSNGLPNLNRVGRYGERYFYSWSVDRVPNYI